MTFIPLLKLPFISSAAGMSHSKLEKKKNHIANQRQIIIRTTEDKYIKKAEINEED